MKQEKLKKWMWKIESFLPEFSVFHFSFSIMPLWRDPDMEITLYIEPAVACFYSHVAEAAGRPLEQVLSDALFKLAGELSLEALKPDWEGKL